MERLPANDKEKIMAKLRQISYSGLPSQLSPMAVCRHVKSLHGRDFKVFAQIALFVLWDHLLEPEKSVWKALSRVNL